MAERYRLERPIGRGGSAEVWRAHDERLDRTVAIKVLHPHLLPDATSIERFIAEARSAAGLTHPAIVPVFDVVEDAAMPAIVFRYVDGETLADRIARLGPIPAPEAAAIAADLAGALAHAHQVGLVHRDVKPGNVLIDADGRAQLVDFGIARVVRDADARQTAAGNVLGTLRYMAPEQLAGRPTDTRTDLYALGLVLHELLAGRPPFPATSPAGLVDAQRDGPPPPPAGTPAPLAALLAELLALDPADRPADATSVENRLRSVAVARPSLGQVAVGAAMGGAHQAPASSSDDAGPEADTVAFAAPPTVALAVPALPVPGLATPARTSAARRTRPRPLARWPQHVRRPGAVAIGSALAGVGAIVLAALVLGGGLGNTPAVVDRAGASASVQLGSPPAAAATAPPRTTKPAHGGGHGKHGGGDN